MKLGLALNVYNKPFEVVENIRAWKHHFKTPTMISVFSNYVNFGRKKQWIEDSDFYSFRMQYRSKRVETPLTLVDAVRPFIEEKLDLDFIIFSHCDYFYLNESILLDKLEEIKRKGLGGGAHLDCNLCSDSSEFRGIIGKMGKVRKVSAYCLMLTPEFIMDYKFLDMKPFDAVSIPGLEDGGTADTFTEHFYKNVGPSWPDMILDFPNHGLQIGDKFVNNLFPDTMMIHSHLQLPYIKLREMFCKEVL